MSLINFQTNNQTYRMLMGNGLIYTVPPFQRDYSWTEEEWNDLWEDITQVLGDNSETAHYMGYLVLQTRDSKHFEIIDGQQRLTTLSLIVLATLAGLRQLIEKKIEPENNQRRLDQLRNSLIGYLDPVTLLPRSKLNLNRNNNNLFQNYLIPLLPLPKRNLKSTEVLLGNAFEWFLGRIAKVYPTGEELAAFIDRLIDRLFFTVISVSDELNAYKVFETLNARGVRLSSTDLLKNYMFSVVHNQSNDAYELAQLDHRWEQLAGKLGGEEFPDFLRVHWNSRKPFLRHGELFRRIRDQVRNREDVFRLIREMDEDVETYVSLSRPEDESWNAEQKKYIGELKLFYVRQAYPMLLAAKRKFSNSDFTLLLKAVSIISFRYNVISNYPGHDQEPVYTQTARMIEQGSSLKECFSFLRQLYVQDDDFKRNFASKSLKTTQSRNKRIVRYLLFAIEAHVSGNTFDFDSPRYNLEHVLPENPEKGWTTFDQKDHEQFVYRLGNLTLMTTSQNRNLGNAEFEAKKTAYSASEFLLTQRIAQEHLSWTPERIAIHQNWLATQAIAIWKMPQLT
jgi:uncharacterized protein with ParB-like and HNH nuclease domain